MASRRLRLSIKAARAKPKYTAGASRRRASLSEPAPLRMQGSGMQMGGLAGSRHHQGRRARRLGDQEGLRWEATPHREGTACGERGSRACATARGAASGAHGKRQHPALPQPSIPDALCCGRAGWDLNISPQKAHAKAHGHAHKPDDCTTKSERRETKVGMQRGSDAGSDAQTLGAAWGSAGPWAPVKRCRMRPAQQRRLGGHVAPATARSAASGGRAPATNTDRVAPLRHCPGPHHQARAGVCAPPNGPR